MLEKYQVDKIHLLNDFQPVQISATGKIIHKDLKLLEIGGMKFVLRKEDYKYINNALSKLNTEQIDYIKRNFNQRKYNCKRLGRKVDNATILKILITKII